MMLKNILKLRVDTDLKEEVEEMKETDDKVYSAWRRYEAYQVPMTKEGMKRAEERFNQFKKGFDYGVKACMLELEEEHKCNKKSHNFYLFAKEICSKLRCFK